MDDQSSAHAFSALGNPHRVAMLRLLVRAGEDGLNVSQIQKAIGLPPTTLAHHIAALSSGGVVIRERRGRETICRADFPAIRALNSFLMQDCCAGVFLCAESANATALKTKGGINAEATRSPESH